ncbi:MAG: hypothetical protein MJ195_02000 [Mycoplasmoidaceae bacterium]|nr:hypothetical protein [Mycoplasmoidaceae bacterium]
MLEEANREVQSVLKAIYVAKTYNIANNMFFTEAAQIDPSFAASLSEDLNLPNAITTLLEQIKMLNSIIRDKKFFEANKLCNILARELDVLGIKYDSQKHLASIDSIKK